MKTSMIGALSALALLCGTTVPAPAEPAQDGDAWQQKLNLCELEYVVVNQHGVIEGIE